MQPNSQSQHPAAAVLFVFRAVRSRNYRLFFIGQSISLIGTWVARVAISWLVYRMTDSPFWLGVVGFAGQIPTFALVPIAGVLADRLDRFQILLWSQVAFLLQSGVLAYLVLSGQVEVWHIVVISFFQGIVNAFDIPARQSLLPDMIEKHQDLSNAIALNSSMFNGARLVGPAIAGVLISFYGEGVCFIIDTVSFAAVIISLLLMKLKKNERRKEPRHVLVELREGVAYAFNFIPIRVILLHVSMVSLMGMTYMVLLPIYAKDILLGGPHTLGFLTAASGLGALTGALYLASRKTVVGLEHKIVSGSFLSCAGLFFFSISNNLWICIAFVLLASFGIMIMLASSNTMLQTLVDDDKRGRVMSLYTMAFLGVAPFGSLLAGSLAAWIGPQWTILIGAIFCAVSGFLFMAKLKVLQAAIHPVFVRKGILPQIASGIQTVSDLSSPKD